MSKFFSLVAAALIGGVFAGSASAAPLYDLTLQASADGGNTWTTNLTVAANTSYLYEVVGQEAPIGTNNGTKTITSQTSVDGMSSMSFNVSDTGSNAIPVVFSGAALQNNYNTGSGASAGTLTQGGTGITGVRPIENGTAGPGQVVILSGMFATGSTVGESSVINMTFGSSAGGIKINNGAAVLVAANTNLISGNSGSTAGPAFGFTGLTLAGPAVSAVPEPASLIMSGLGFAGVAGLSVVRRRRRPA